MSAAESEIANAYAFWAHHGPCKRCGAAASCWVNDDASCKPCSRARGLVSAPVACMCGATHGTTHDIGDGLARCVECGCH